MQSILNDNHLVGYSNKLSVQPCEELDFMISCTEPQYKAEVVRLIHGDNNPNGPGHKDKKISSNIDGYYGGRIQTINSGSYIKINDSTKVNLNKSFTFQTWIYPTNLHNQAIIAQSSLNSNYEIEINHNGQICFSINYNDDKLSVNSG